ncbi:amidohydrolase family protein [Haloarcula nitratireducens]|uniref:Amidohydrolase family protein n=1 Tax=Haloarcula nitratireducens TaxID=2487749 RepID=A0AAW4PJ95_9EURY|nr:amidohydrolase family protein [Halomicroarcula nitratireducens]MBX0297297.1 amidohydrolase family protein [Halomicroarcula nitratireducens]
MRFVDTHTHTWGPNTEELPWSAEILPPGWDGAYTARDLIADMDATGVDESVMVTTPMYGRGIRANEYTMRSIEAYPDRLWGVGLMDFYADDPEAVRADLRRVVGHDRMLGVRMHACLRYEEHSTELDRTADWILDDELEPIWEEAAAQDTAIFVFPKAEQLSMIETLAGRHPDVRLVVDHMAFPDETTDPDEEPWTDFESLAGHENVAVKVSSLPRSSDSGWPYEDLWDYVRHLAEWFSAERLMLGSDYPWMDDWADYEDCLSWVEEVPFLSARDYSYLAHRTFESIHES